MFLKQVCCKAGLRDASIDLGTHFIHEVRVEFDVLLALLDDLRLPGGEDAGDVLEDRIPLDGKLAGDAARLMSSVNHACA